MASEINILLAGLTGFALILALFIIYKTRSRIAEQRKKTKEKFKNLD